MQEYFSTETAIYFETEPFSRILSLIGDGQENAIHKADLIRCTGLPDRELRKTIEFLRRKGVVIISDNSGYYYPQDKEELNRYIERENSRAKSVFYTLRSAKRLLKSITNNAD